MKYEGNQILYTRKLYNVGECPPPHQFTLCNEALLPFKAELFPHIVFRLSHNALATFIFMRKWS